MGRQDNWAGKNNERSQSTSNHAGNFGYDKNTEAEVAVVMNGKKDELNLGTAQK